MQITKYELTVVEASDVTKIDEINFEPGQLIIVDGGAGIYYDPTNGKGKSDRFNISLGSDSISELKDSVAAIEQAVSLKADKSDVHCVERISTSGSKHISVHDACEQAQELIIEVSDFTPSVIEAMKQPGMSGLNPEEYPCSLRVCDSADNVIDQCTVEEAGIYVLNCSASNFSIGIEDTYIHNLADCQLTLQYNKEVTIQEALDNKLSENRVIKSIDANSTNQIPTASAVKTYLDAQIGDIESALNNIISKYELDGGN